MDSLSSTSSSGTTWISWFLSLPGHQVLTHVDEAFLQDAFNLQGLRHKIQLFDEALDLVLSPEPPEDEELGDSKFLETYRDAVDLFCLVHQRWLGTQTGMDQAWAKYEAGEFGACPRVMCGGQSTVPSGADELRVARVGLYCPRCEQVYMAPKALPPVDGAFFGASFPHAFLSANHLVPAEMPESFAPRVYGFKLNGKSGLIDVKRSQLEDFDQRGGAAQIRALPWDGRAPSSFTRDAPVALQTQQTPGAPGAPAATGS